mmetsp:Transcript_96683/g.207494  ORF Transcript_96683/g.207494 Transcript_96683/m.207494 type:complete len:83 (-) Transcript_96683:1370-1618(-)
MHTRMAWSISMISMVCQEAALPTACGFGFQVNQHPIRPRTSEQVLLRLHLVRIQTSEQFLFLNNSFHQAAPHLQQLGYRIHL